MTTVLIYLFYLAIFALVVAAAGYVYKTRDEAATHKSEDPETGPASGEP